MAIQVSAGKIPETKKLYFKVLGRTLEHFGVQMYKRRAIAIAELVANCWDAGAKLVIITLPSERDYNPTTSTIEIKDNGRGMSFGDIQERYLVLGKNRRQKDGVMVSGRPLMGRKGIGKLAGFGLASCMKVMTWQGDEAFQFELEKDKLKASDNTSESIPIPWQTMTRPKDVETSGTLVRLSNLKHKTPLGIDELKMSLARRFARKIRGEMTILVNGGPLPDPIPKLIHREPENGEGAHEIAAGQHIKYWYGFAEDVIKEKEQRGFAIMVNGKVAQAPPFFFDVEATASGQHSTKYVVGEIEADFLDSGVDDESDIIATDRQEIDWEDERIKAFKTWGENLARKSLSDCRDFRGARLENWVLTQEEFTSRIGRLDQPSQRQVKSFIRTLGTVLEESDRSRELVSALIRAYEFRNFHDVIEQLEDVSEDADALATLLGRLNDWQVLEGRAILEVVTGRLAIIDKFEKMIVEDAPETAPKIGADNMHDLIAGQPWLLNPDWQVYREEVGVTTLMREWGVEEEEDDRKRLDFLGLKSDQHLVIIEIKRSNHPTDIEELTRLMRYREKLARAHGDNIYMVLLCGREPKVSKDEINNWSNSKDREIRYWSQVFSKSKVIYEHYRALLDADIAHPDFVKAMEEVRETRKIINGGAVYRGQEARKMGVGGQDVDYMKAEKDPDA